MWTRETLAAHLATGVTVEFFFFWGHTPKDPGTVDRSCLSQWFLRAFELEGTQYASAEHWMMESKARLFGQHPDLRAFLLGTGDSVLVEAAPRDVVWGIGLGASNPLAREPARWRGKNLLGFALMEARAALSNAKP